MTMPRLLPTLAVLVLGGSLLSACANTDQTADTMTSTTDYSAALETVVAARSEENRVRDPARNPVKTLQFFQVEPGMTVAEALPGRGWYTQILASYLGSDGTLYGVNYANRMWNMFSWATPQWVSTRKAGTAAFPDMVARLSDSGISAAGFAFEDVPEAVIGTVDRVLLIRALHNLNRFEADASTRTNALADVHAMLKDDGMVGVVQHRAPESASDEGAQGARGYLKQSAVIAMFEAAGFELVRSAEINANSKDRPGEADVVWRLPPSLRGTEAGTQERAAMELIGESDRMTLLFKKAG